MKTSKFSESQIVAILGSAGKDKSIEDVCREHGISPATFYNWKSKYGGMVQTSSDECGNWSQKMQG